MLHAAYLTFSVEAIRFCSGKDCQNVDADNAPEFHRLKRHAPIKTSPLFSDKFLLAVTIIHTATPAEPFTIGGLQLCQYSQSRKTSNEKRGVGSRNDHILDRSELLH